MRPQTLYKIHGLRACDLLQTITRYLYAIDIDARPINIIERNFPYNIKPESLPIIVYSNGFTIIGLTNIIKYYESMYKISNLMEKSMEFEKNNPNYKITDKATHKNIKN